MKTLHPGLKFMKTLHPGLKLGYSGVQTGYGTVGGLLAFSDNFNRANTANGWGTDWVPCMGNDYLPGSTASTLFTFTDINTNRARWKTQGTGAGGDAAINCYMLPRNLSPAMYGKSQFAQATFVSSTASAANTMRTGISVFMTPNLTSLALYGYGLATAIETNQFVLRTCGNNTTIGGPYALTAGDILRLEVRGTATNSELKVYRNGALIDTVNNASILLTGLPAMNGWGLTNALAGARFENWDDFSCGVL